MSEFVNISEQALEALERGEMLALATVVRVRGSAPRHEGARMLIWPDGSIAGTIGGSALEQRVIEHAVEALRARHSRFESYLLSTDDDPESLGLCGGAVEVHIEVIEPDAVLVIIGAGHIALPLASMAKLMGMRVVVADDRAEYVTKDRFPVVDELIRLDYDQEAETLSSLPLSFRPQSYVVVATWGWDEPALAAILASDPQPDYVGLVASRTKARVIRERLSKRGVSAEAVGRVRAPVGLDLGAETPGEIALSILAEILQLRRHATGRPLAEAQALIPEADSE